jgi:hypothetical protein
MDKTFPMYPRSERDMLRGRKIHGVAVNDAPYIVTPTINGRQVSCPIFRTWRGMLDRCYSPYWAKRRPELAENSVCEDWLHFMNFRDWVLRQSWEGRHLDKDILNPGNRTYGPENCAFVWPATNTLMQSRHYRGSASGVDKNMGRWRAQYSGKLLGRFDTENEARWVWKAARAKALAEAAMVETDPRIPPALLRHAAKLIAEETDHE